MNIAHQQLMEDRLVRRLGNHGVHVNDGVTDPDIRKERIRRAILDNDLAEVIVGNTVRYREAFKLTYGEEL